jgi:lysozyme family protein
MGRMDGNYSQCLALVLVSEGGNDDDPRDPGGRTSRGITQRELDAYRRSKGLSTQDVWQASTEEIADIYRIGYWEPWCAKLPGGLDYSYFDMAVNQGSHEATLLLQRALGVTADGRIGIVTLQAAVTANPLSTIVLIAQERRAFYRGLSTFKYFGRGWLDRVERVQVDSIKMATQEGSAA